MNLLGYYFGIMFILVMYLVFFGIFVLCNVLLGLKQRQQKQQTRSSRILAIIHFSVPILGVIGYPFIDYFEALQLEGIWWGGMLALHLAPIVANLLLQHLHKHPKLKG